MLDRDLTDLYGVETKAINQAGSRNTARFPADFAFRLTQVEEARLRSQIVTSKGRGGRRHPPRAFTEQGVAMLSSVLKSRRAVSVNIAIAEVFRAIRILTQPAPAPEVRPRIGFTLPPAPAVPKSRSRR